MRPAKLDWVRNEIARVCRAVRAQDCEIQLMKRAAIPTASTELLLARMRAKLDDLCHEREVLSQAQGPELRRAGGARDVEMSRGEPPADGQGVTYRVA